jgi:hypothetical protein
MPPKKKGRPTGKKISCNECGKTKGVFEQCPVCNLWTCDGCNPDKHFKQRHPEFYIDDEDGELDDIDEGLINEEGEEEFSETDDVPERVETKKPSRRDRGDGVISKQQYDDSMKNINKLKLSQREPLPESDEEEVGEYEEGEGDYEGDEGDYEEEQQSKRSR